MSHFLIRVTFAIGDFNANVRIEDISKPTIRNVSLHKKSNDNGVRVVNFAISKNVAVKNTIFPHCNIHKYTGTSADGLTHKQIGHILKDKRRCSSLLDVRSFMAAECDIPLFDGGKD
jgi:hypothetical protein